MNRIAPIGVRIRLFLVIVLLVVIVLEALFFFADRAVLGQMYARTPAQTPSILATYDDFADDCPREAVEFELDGKTLRGYVYGPDNTRGLIIFRHGIFSHHQEYLPFITAMAGKGWKVFAYDAIGCGESDGDDVIGFAQSPRDVAAAVNYARESGMADGMKVALWGHSWGGYGVAGALDLVDVDACVTMSGFDTPMKIIESGAQQSVGLFAFTQTPTLWLNNKLAFGEDADRSASRAIIESGTPTFVIHGSGDKVVPYDDASILSSVLSDGEAPANVTTKTLSEPGRCGHNDYFYSRESLTYFNACYEKLQQILDENGDDPGDPEVIAFVESVDRLRANTADPELIDEIDAFLGIHLA